MAELAAGIEEALLEDLTPGQRDAVRSEARRLLVIAGAGSGKTEVMARRIGWWLGVNEVPRESVVAFTFTERAAEEMKFRIREVIQRITPEGEDVTLGGMYVGTIHSYCLNSLRQLRPDRFHNYDILDEAARVAVVQGVFHSVLGLSALQSALTQASESEYDFGFFATIDRFLLGYDLLNEYGRLDVELPAGEPPSRPGEEVQWCKEARLRTPVGQGDVAQAFGVAAARFYAYLRCRRFLDFSTSQSELVRLLESDGSILDQLRSSTTHVVVDEVQDINPIQDTLVRLLVADSGSLTSVGDHRQAIFGWRGGRVDIMGRLFEEISADQARDGSGQVVELAENFRSTQRIIDLGNLWAQTIGAPSGMASPDMTQGRAARTDVDPSHVSCLGFPERPEEAGWIADAVQTLVRGDGTGARHDTRDGDRGLAYSDIAVLIRSSTDARTYMRALEDRGIPAVFRAGPDLFSQPEVLLFVAALARTAGIDRFVGGQYDQKSLPNRIDETLDGCSPEPEAVIHAAAEALREEGLSLADDVERRLLLVSDLLQRRISGEAPPAKESLRELHTADVVQWLRTGQQVRRVFPQRIFHLLLAEGGAREWDGAGRRGNAAMFHLGQLSSLLTQIETPGWVSSQGYKYAVVALLIWGTQNARTEEAPLLVAPDAVTISTVHTAKGLEWPVVFVADIRARRFPSQRARSVPRVPFDEPLTEEIDPRLLADNDNYDAERRLMYVAITRAERFLFLSYSGDQQSRFMRQLAEMFQEVGGLAFPDSPAVPSGVEYRETAFDREKRLVTSFSDLRYYLECPHDFYLRKVVGFAPTIDQAFGYGRNVHNIMREIHSDPKKWAELATNREVLEKELWGLIDRGIFYLRYTTGEPADNMRRKAVKIVGDYVERYFDELARLTFEPEREFETLVEEEQTLIGGAMDLIRLDDPPRVTIIDFKSGEPESDVKMKLDEDEMRLQVTTYGMAAKKELEYEPERGFVRYLGEAQELDVPMDEAAIAEARRTIVKTARGIRNREFDLGPQRPPRDEAKGIRCAECDFLLFCGRPEPRELA
jgi:DNA helicase-2/ATP-dependent DNA helicase PcrA